MKVQLSTPAYGGMLTVPYVHSLLGLADCQAQLGIDLAVDIGYGESLIPRARNACAMRAIENGADKLLFVDADINFGVEQVQMLLASKSPIVGGVYPLKSFPVTLNFNPLPEMRDLFQADRQIDNYLDWMLKYADENGEVEVTHLPTGFMMIDVNVLRALAQKVKSYSLFMPDTKRIESFYEFFPSGADGTGNYESEDWAFCRIAKEAGFKVTLQTKAVVSHFGNHEYSVHDLAHVVKRKLPIIG